MDKEKFNERICRIIWHDALQNSIKPFLWSIDFRSIKVIDNGTEFMFQNHKKTGKVIIQYSERTGLFNVTIIHANDERNPVIIENVYIDMLVSVIDENLSCHELVEHGVAV
ncbi:hypothetical protein [Bacteroides mediterraneensis]|uniref:hypothetical protein n=1 Tax=Bacteroides mediterraneensis TaxID=1841856 RepID=UPI00195CA1EE|nr:hypothetical protein [Bacteroides mediterraneensis]MBM6782701.1 hypothetical protein [Bacteroides mediterraneensis]